MRAAKKALGVLLAFVLAASLALPALAQEQAQGQAQDQTQAQTQTQAQAGTGGKAQLPAGLVDEVKSLDRAQLLSLAELVRQRLKETAPQEFAGVVTAVYGDSFTVAKGGKGSQAVKTFALTAETKIIGEGTLKGAKEIKPGMMAKVTATADGKALVVRLLPAKKGEALKEKAKAKASAKPKAPAKGKGSGKKPSKKPEQEGRKT